MGVSRVHRLLRLITVLQRDEPNTTAGLLRELNVSRRTFFRDLKLLQEAGIPYRHDRAQGYHLDKGFYLPPINLTVPETLGLMLLGKSAAAHNGGPMMGPALSAVYKLIATVPDPIRKACSEIMSNVSIATDAHIQTEQWARHHALLQRCLDEGRTCRFVYKGPTDPEEINARLSPYLMHFANRAWYVLGYVDVYDEVRVLKLTRFLELDPTDEYFNKPDNYRVEDKLGAAWRLVPEGREYKIVLMFSKKVATNVSEVLWHRSQQQKILDDGRCEMTFTIDGINEIAWWLCGYGDQVVVVKPPELRDRIEAMLCKALKQYEPDESLPAVIPGRKPKTKSKNTPRQG